MAQNPMIEQARQGNVAAITDLMNRLLKSQGMLANVEREGDHLEVLIKSDKSYLRSLDDELQVPNRQVLMRMLEKLFSTLEVQAISRITISWQQTGFDKPVWTEEISLLNNDTNINHMTDATQNGGIDSSQERLTIPPLPIFPPKSMRDDEQHHPLVPVYRPTLRRNLMQYIVERANLYLYQIVIRYKISVLKQNISIPYQS